MNGRRSDFPCGTMDCPIGIYHNGGKGELFSFSGHWHTATEFLLLKSGSMELVVEGKEIVLEEGEILLIEPRLPHSMKVTSPEVRFVQLQFSPEAVALPPHHILQSGFIAPLYAGTLHFPGVLRPGHPAYEEVYGIMSDLRRYRMSTANYKLRRFAVVAALCAVLAPYCSQDQEEGEHGDLPDNETVKKVVIYIQNSRNRNLTLDKIAEHVHLHPNYLCALFKKHMGQSIFRYINRRQIEHAAVILRNEEIPISQVAEIVGFRSNSLFYKKFREIMGCTPLAYARKSMGNNGTAE